MRNVFEYIDDVHLEHHGIKGQKWGVRRFQNSDGTLTDIGKQRYGQALVKNDKARVNNKSESARRNSTREGQELRKGLYESSKECKAILDKVRAKSERFLEDNTDKTFNELCDLAPEFRKAANKMFKDVLSAYGDTSVKEASGKYKLLDVLTDKAGYDDFWSYAYGEWK